LNHLPQSPGRPSDRSYDPHQQRFFVKTKPSSLQLRCQLQSLVRQPQSLILVEEAMPIHFTFKLRLLILQHLPLHQTLLAGRTHGDGWRTGKAAAACSAQPP